jgi:hypothetical protein
MWDDPSHFLSVFFGIETAFQTHARFFVFGCGCCNEREERDLLLDVVQFRSQGEQLFFRRQPAWMFGIQSNASEVVSNAQAH